MATCTENRDDLPSTREAENWIDLMGHGESLKKVLKPGSGEHPEFQDLVTVHVVGKVAGDDGPIFMDTRAENRPLVFQMGENILHLVVPGLSIAIKSMLVGEVATVKVASRFGYGPQGLPPKVPSDADLSFDVELLSVQDLEQVLDGKSVGELCEYILRYKLRGNEFFGQKQWRRAVTCYKEVLKFGEAMQFSRSEPIWRDLEISCHNNLAATYEMMQDLKSSKEACIEVLSIDNNNVKALIRAGRIATGQGEFEEATAALEKALALENDNKAVQKECSRLERKIKQYKLKQSKAFKGAFVKSPKSNGDEPSRDKPSTLSTESIKSSMENKIPAKLSTIETTHGHNASEKQSVAKAPRRNTWISKAAVLLAPSLVVFFAILVMQMTSVSASGIKPSQWTRNTNKAIKKLSNEFVNYNSMSCDGESQTPACCSCRWIIRELTSLVEKNAKLQPLKMGFRMDGKKELLGRPENRVMNILDKICNRVPLAIPKAETRLEMAKSEFSQVCTDLIDTYHDELLSMYRIPDPATNPEEFVCGTLTAACPTQVPWTTLLSSTLNDNNLDLSYETLLCSADTPPQPRSEACCICEKSANAAEAHVRSMSGDEFNGFKKFKEVLVRDSKDICSTIKMNIPKKETRLELVTNTLGRACVQFIHKLDNDVVENTIVSGSFSSKICQDVCGDGNEEHQQVRFSEEL